MSRCHEPEQADPVDQDAMTRIDLSVPTALIKLTPQFRAAIGKIAPKRRRSKIPFIVAFGPLVFAAMFAADGSCREFAMDRARAVAVDLRRAPEIEPAIEAPRVVAAVAAVVPIATDAATTRKRPAPERRHRTTSRR
jgi:hypothetical protein